MKKICLILLSLVVASFIPAVFAQEAEILTQESLTIYAGETKYINITIKNNQELGDIFSLGVDPEIYEGVTATPEKNIVSLDAFSNKTIKLYFSVEDCANEGSIQFKVSARSVTGLTASKNIILNVLRRFTVCISDFRLSKYGEVEPSDTITISVSVKNPTERISPEFFLQTNIKKEGETIEKFEDKITVAQKTTKTISHDYTFDKYAAPGDYVIETLLKDKTNTIKSSSSYTIRVKEINKTVMEKWTSFGILSAVTTIKVKNEGNVPVPVKISTTIPSFAKNLFFPITGMTVKTEMDGWSEYSWYFESVEPGSEVMVKYEIKLLYVWMFFIIVAAITALAFKFAYGPTIVKRYKPFGPISLDKEVAIALEVKNRSRNEIRDVEVRDFAPSLFTVSEKFDTLKPRIMKKTEAGTTLAWKFDSLKPFEERVLTYRIKPVMEISGTLTLPRASLKYLDKKKERRSVLSKTLLIKAG